jgi:hypothetical protein
VFANRTGSVPFADYATRRAGSDIGCVGQLFVGHIGIWEDRNEEGDAASVAPPRRMVTHHPYFPIGLDAATHSCPWSRFGVENPGDLRMHRSRSHLGLSGIGRGY